MGLFDFFKKEEKEEKEEPKIDFTVMELQKGFIVDYDLKSWEVTKVADYDWGDDYFTKEYLLDSGGEKIYLNVDDNDGLACSVWSNVELIDIDENLALDITAKDDAPDRLTYQEKIYIRIESSQGHSIEGGDKSELVNWTYQNKETKEYISINRWGEEEYDSSLGKDVRVGAFSNILPR